MEIPSDLILKDPIMIEYYLKAPISTSDAEAVFTVDEALAIAGNNQFYQKRTTFFLSLQWMVFAFIILGQSFLFLPPTFLCPDSNSILQQCPETSACRYDPPRIDPSSKNTITNEFSLYCAKGYAIFYWFQCSYFVFLIYFGFKRKKIHSDIYLWNRSYIFIDRQFFC